MLGVQKLSEGRKLWFFNKSISLVTGRAVFAVLRIKHS